ncbi:hypothetical protein [Microvirga guangxiensis]|uniref:Uncharacterized protein n=1 Tax=Microvirga guangxiensis TaxID=549386 RepID=A0A1G5CTX5_9HYPH|nr:hypothetical protein [Microvirga guangxiensis]SCY05905.1 hypothetical protein SAMN02927923_00671 [Microvirga guangxiensis]
MRRLPLDQEEALNGYVDVNAFEEVLACNIKDVVADFCLVDAEIIRSYVSNQLHGNVDEIVASCTELFFKGHTLSYARSAGISAALGHPPCVVLDMAFSHETVSIDFKLVLAEFSVGVHINRVMLSEAPDTDFDPRSFARIITSARLRPLPTRFRSAYCPASSLRH